MKSFLLFLFVCAFGATIPAFGHHSFAMFELTKDVTYEGTVMEYRWENPHTHIIVKIDSGELAGTWDVEGGSTAIMGRQGWSRVSYKAGDHIKLVGHPMKDGSKGVSLFYAVKEDGTRMYHDIARPKAGGGTQP